VRKVFSSRRLENAEGVAELLRKAGIEVRITNGRSYRGNRRGTFSYSDPTAPESEVWVVRSEQQLPARELLREAGLIDSTRPGEGYSFRAPLDATAARTPANRRLLRIKLGLLALIALAVVLAGIHTLNRVDPEPQLASPPFDGSTAATLPPVARAVFASDVVVIDTPVACLGIDGGDASEQMIETLPRQGALLVPATWCVEVADEARGSFHRASGSEATIVDVHAFRPTAPDRGTVEVSAYHHRSWASYKTLEVARIEGEWQVVDVVKHVESRGLMGF